MKTIKELEAEFTQENLIIAKALKEVVELIDSGDFDKNCYECDKCFDKEELKARING
tara:strand:- start:854 stop:1024 length:171 start_codon:yes stop_codon:yes gene_type:complete